LFSKISAILAASPRLRQLLGPGDAAEQIIGKTLHRLLDDARRFGVLTHVVVSGVEVVVQLGNVGMLRDEHSHLGQRFALGRLFMTLG
jgi:hypothetical protein